MVTQDFGASAWLIDANTQSAAAIRRDESVNPIASLLDDLGRSDLGDYVLTTSIEFETTSAVPRYPLESGADASDHTVLQPPVIRMRGAVPAHAGGGSGASDVSDEIRRAQTDGNLFTIETARGTIEDCVVSAFREVQSDRTGVGLEFGVDVTQVQLGATERSRINDPNVETARDFVSDDTYDQLVGPVTADDRAATRQILDDRNVRIDEGYLYTLRPPVPTFADELDDDAKSFVKAQVTALVNAGKEVPAYPLAFIRALDASKLAKRIGAPLPAPGVGIPVAGVDMLRVGMEGGATEQRRAFGFAIDGVSHRVTVVLRRVTPSAITGPSQSIIPTTPLTGAGWVIDVTIGVEGGPELRRSELRGVRLLNGSVVKLYTPTPSRFIGALLVVSLVDDVFALGPRPWGLTHDLIFTSNLQYIASQD